MPSSMTIMAVVVCGSSEGGSPSMAIRRIPPFLGVCAPLKVEKVMHKSAAEKIAIIFLETISYLLLIRIRFGGS